jgi:single-strand DNA-binding protein
MYLNRVLLIGNLTRDPQQRALPSGMNVTEIGLATNRTYKDKNGQRQESTDYHNVVIFGRQAETTAQYLHKGDTAMIEGRIQTRSWEQNGEKKYRTEIVADRVQFGPKRGSAAATQAEAPQSATKKSAAKNAPEELDTIQYPEEDIDPDEIPF